MKPPARRGAHPAVSRRFIVENADWDHRPFPGRSDQRRLVNEPEVAAEPQDGRHVQQLGPFIGTAVSRASRDRRVPFSM